MISGSLRNPYLVVALSLAIILLGGFAYSKIPADLLPQFETSAVQFDFFYPGMPPKVMEKDIMSRPVDMHRASASQDGAGRSVCQGFF